MFWLLGPDDDECDEEERGEESKETAGTLDEFAWVDEVYDSDVNTVEEDAAGPGVEEQVLDIEELALDVENSDGFACLGEVDESDTCVESTYTVPISFVPTLTSSTSFQQFGVLTQIPIDDRDAEGAADVEDTMHCFAAGPLDAEHCVFEHTRRKSSTRKRKREDADEGGRLVKRFCMREY
jgi:hypothetical protein